VHFALKKKENGVVKVRSRLFRTAVCFILIMTLVMCEATIGFAIPDAATNDSTVSGETAPTDNNGETTPTEPVEKNYDDWTVNDVAYKSHVFASGNSYTYTGKAIKPTLKQLTVTVTYEKDGTTEAVEKVITDFKANPVSYSNNTAIGTGAVNVNVEGKSVQIPFTIVFGNVSSIKTKPTSYKTIKVYWSKVAGASGYVVYRSTKSTSGFKAIKTITSGSTVSYSNTNLKLGNTYYYKVRPYRTVDGSKVYGQYSTAVKQKVQPAPPAISSVKRTAYNKLKITWKKVSGASGYRIYRSTSPNGTYKKIATVRSSKKLYYTDKKRTCGKTYYYKVRAYKRGGGKNHYSSYSAYMAGRTTPAKTKFNSKTQIGATSVTLKWNKSAGASGYDIYRSTNSKTGFAIVKTITSSKTLSCTDRGLNEKTKYYYKVRPFKMVSGKKVYGAYSSTYTKHVITERMASLIKNYKGKPYRWGGNTPKGWDCSGFVQWAINYLYGKKIPRTGGAQARNGKYVNKNKMSSWKPGDVLIYSRNGGGVSHVGLYIGGGKMMHALNSRYDTVIQDVGYYEKWDRGNHLSGVRRYN